MTATQVLILDKELKEIDGSIRSAKNSLLLWSGLCVAFYLVWFVLWKFCVVDVSPGIGGTLGDYIGGLINPVVAFAAFYWLTKGVRMQKLELHETRQALSDQAASGRASVRIDALSSMINAHTSDIAYRREHLAFLMSQRVNSTANSFFSMRGKSMNATEFEDLLKKLNHGIEVRAKERVRFTTELHMLLKQTRTQDEERDFQTMQVPDQPDDDGSP